VGTYKEFTGVELRSIGAVSDSLILDRIQVVFHYLRSVSRCIIPIDQHFIG
jgi:hypothetical protein